MRGRPRRVRHAPRAASPRRLYAEPYERTPAPGRRAAASVRRLLRRRTPRAARLERAVYNLLQGNAARAGALATVVYSDRYFRYGLPLHARLAPARAEDAQPRPARPVHFVPLRPTGPRNTLRSGLLSDAAARLISPPARYAPLRRSRRDVPRVFSVAAPARFWEVPTSEYRARSLPLNYRQPADGVEPRAMDTTAGERRWRRESPASARSSGEADAPRPEFALPDDETAPRRASATESAYERTYGALAKEAPVDAANVAGEPADKAAGKTGPLRRKVLNTERYNNGARAAAMRRGGPRRRVRAAVRTLLACSGAFYALALLAFYFLSLA